MSFVVFFDQHENRVTIWMETRNFDNSAAEIFNPTGLKF